MCFFICANREVIFFSGCFKKITSAKYQILVEGCLVQLQDVYWWHEEYYHQHSSQYQCRVQTERSHKKMLNKIGPRIDPCGDPKSISLQGL